MLLNRMHLHDFRNYASQKVEFVPGINLITGDNGQGKTNLLEAVHFCCLAHSMRTRKEKEMIRWNTSALVVRLEGRLGENEHSQSVEIKSSGHKRVSVGGNKSKRLSDLMGYFTAVALTPDDNQIISGGPAERRRFLDGLFCQHDRDYLEALRKYGQALKQRNALLKQDHLSDSLLEIFTSQLVEWGIKITGLRLRHLEELSPLASELYTRISAGKERLEIHLDASILDQNLGTQNPNDLESVFRNKINRLKKAERELGTTLVGPHRDDFLLLLSGRKAREYASQGQKRSIALSLKLAAASLLEKVRKVPPILLLDDVFAELDYERRMQLSEIVGQSGQVLIASPREQDIPFAVSRKMVVGAGTILSVDE